MENIILGRSKASVLLQSLPVNVIFPASKIFKCNLSYESFQAVPKCTTIQEQMDPNEKFNSLYVTKLFDSYIKVTGEYFVNTSVPIFASVNLTCFYEGRITEKIPLNE